MLGGIINLAYAKSRYSRSPYWPWKQPRESFIHLQKALFKIDEEIGPVVACSKCYKNKAVGFDGDDFINACIAVKTKLDPHEVLNKLLLIENKLGRKRKAHFSYTNRPIDLDLLFYENLTIQTVQLELPHPRIAQRDCAKTFDGYCASKSTSTQ